MKNLKEIYIVFSNCDSIKIMRDCIYNFGANGITESMTLFANACDITKVADEIFLTLNWDKTKGLKTGGYEKMESTLAQMLETCNITSYHLYFDDKSELSLLVPWEYEEDVEKPYYKENNIEEFYYKKNDIEIHERWSNNGETELMSITHKRTK